MENYFIIHGSFSSPYSNQIGGLHDFIEGEGKQVYVPDFPIGVGYQNYGNWSKLLKYYLDKVKVKKLIFVCGFNNYLGINEEYDAVNKSMYFDNLEDVKQYSNEIICFYSDNDPYVKYEVEKDFADKIATEQVFIPKAGHINSESGYDTFEDIVNYI